MRRHVVSRSLIFLSVVAVGVVYQNCSAPINIKPAEQISSTTFEPDSPRASETVCSPMSTLSCSGSNPNGVYSKVCNTNGASYGSCNITSCINGYSFLDGKCSLTSETTFNPKSWMQIDSNSTFDSNNGGHLYYVNGKIIILFMSMYANFSVYDVATKAFISTPPVPTPSAPAVNDRATSFALGNSVYLILGTTLWEYSTVSNNWVNKGIVPGNDHRRAFSFSVNGSAYVNGGFYNEGKTFKYSPSNNQWTQVGDHRFTNASYEYGSHFVLNNKAYIYDGILTEYDPSTDTWTNKNSTYFPYYTTFTMNNKGYLIASKSQYVSPNKLYSYDPSNDSWTELKDYSPNYFCNLYGVGAGTSAYLFVGGNSNSCELWQLTP